MITTTINSAKKVSRTITFPVMAELVSHCESKGLVVLFESPMSGTVLRSNSSHHKVGDYSEGWIEVSDKEWRKFEPGESVTLEQA